MYEGEFLRSVVLSFFSPFSLGEDMATGKDVFRWCLLLVLFAFSFFFFFCPWGYFMEQVVSWLCGITVDLFSSLPHPGVMQLLDWELLRASRTRCGLSVALLWVLSWAKQWWMRQESFPCWICWRNKTRLRLGDFKSPGVKLKVLLAFYLKMWGFFTTLTAVFFLFTNR